MDRQKILIIFAAAWVSAALLTYIFISKTRGPKTEATKRILAVSRDAHFGVKIDHRDVDRIDERVEKLDRGGFCELDVFAHALADVEQQTQVHLGAGMA